MFVVNISENQQMTLRKEEHVNLIHTFNPKMDLFKVTRFHGKDLSTAGDNGSFMLPAI